MRNLLTTEQTAARLGVQSKTVYAYVSRGVLARRLADDGRSSLFDAAEVDRLARRGRPRKDSRPSGRVDVSLATELTSLQTDRLVYRGRDVRELTGLGFETVAEWLWSGHIRERAPKWPALEPALERRLAQLVPRESQALERFAAVAAVMACRQPLRVDLRPDSVMRHGRALISAFVACLPPMAATRSSANATLAARLWPRVSTLPATPARLAALDGALIVLADHELATSTLAVRVAASTRADPFAVVLAGLGALSGPLHGRAIQAAHELLVSARSSGSAERAVAQILASRGYVPGFGHSVYRGADPRVASMNALSAPLCKRSDAAVIAAVSGAACASARTFPTVDFALAALAFACEMPIGATEALFAIARSAGWIAHALEEYGEEPLRFRARALYVGHTGAKQRA